MGRGLTRASSRSTPKTACVSAPASRGTQGTPIARTRFKPSKTHCHPTRLPIHLQIRKGHLCPPPDRRCLGGESPCGPGNTRTSSGCLLWVHAPQHSISPKAEPAHLEPCSSHLFQPLRYTWAQKGLWRPRVDICPNSHSQAFLSLAQQSLGLHCLGPTGGWGLPPPLSGKTKKGPSTGALALSLSLSQSLSEHRGQPTPCLSLSTLLSKSIRSCQPASVQIEPCP